MYVALRIPGAVHLKCFMYDPGIPVTEHIVSINGSHNSDNEMIEQHRAVQMSFDPASLLC